MHRLREYIARIDGSRWILLSQRLKGNWDFLIWGAEPLSGNLNLVDEQTAKVQVASVAERHFAHDGANLPPDVRQLHWQVATEISWHEGRGQMAYER